MKRIFILLIVIILCFCTSCTDPDLFPPTSTRWMSEDKNIEFVVSESGNQIGTMLIDGEQIQFFITCNYSFIMYIYPIEYYYYENVGGYEFPPIEKWSYKVKDDKRIAKVEETTYFEVGQEIVFELIEENVDESEIPYPTEPEILPETPDYDFPYPENGSTVETESKQQNVT